MAMNKLFNRDQNALGTGKSTKSWARARYLAIVYDGDNDGVDFDAAHGGHHSPFHVGETLAFADTITLFRYSHGSHDNQIDLGWGKIKPYVK